MNLAVVQLHVAVPDSESSALSNKEGNFTERSSNGVMEEGSGKVCKASTHPASVVVVDVAIVESHVAALDEQPPTLPKNKERRKMSGNFNQRGDG